MGKPLSAAHKAAISKALRDRNPNGGGSKTSTERRKQRRANRTPEQVEASRKRRQERRAAKQGDAKKAPTNAAKVAADREPTAAETERTTRTMLRNLPTHVLDALANDPQVDGHARYLVNSERSQRGR